MTEDRCRRVRLLLETRYDYLPGTVNGGELMTASGLLKQATKAGPAASASVPVLCGTCKRKGFVMVDERRFRCPACNGATRDPTKDDPTYDLYLGLPTKEARGTQRVSEAEQRPARIKDDATLDLYLWERRRLTYERLGSYRELDHALDRLRDLWPEAFDLIHRIYFRELPPLQMSTGAVDLERRAVIFLAERIPGQIRVPPWLLEDARSRVGRRVAELRSQGMTQGEIARTVGLTKHAVRVLLRSCRERAVVS